MPRCGLAYLARVQVSAAGRFALDQLDEQWEWYGGQLKAVELRLREFAASAPACERSLGPQVVVSEGGHAAERPPVSTGTDLSRGFRSPQLTGSGK